MAKATSPIQFHGRLHNMVFRVRNGKQIVHFAPERNTQHKKRMEHPSRFRAYRLNIREFSVASTTALEIYRSIAPGKGDTLGPVFRPYVQNLLTARLKKSAEHLRKASNVHQWFATTVRLPDIAHALRGLDIGHVSAPADQVRMVPMGPQHNPTSIKVLGLGRAAEAIRSYGNARLEFRFHIRQAAVAERRFDTLQEKWVPLRDNGVVSLCNGLAHYCSQPSDWIPAEIIPAEGFDLPLPTWDDGAQYVTMVAIEWREHRTTGRRIRHHHDKAIARIVAVHGTADDFQPQDTSHGTMATHHTMPAAIAAGTHRPKINWQKDPKAYIQAALAKLKPK